MVTITTESTRRDINPYAEFGNPNIYAHFTPHPDPHPLLHTNPRAHPDTYGAVSSVGTAVRIGSGNEMAG